jgi:protein TonB
VAGLEDEPLFETRPSRPILGAVLDHGKRTVSVGLTIGFLVTLTAHGYASVRAETAMLDMLHWVTDARRDMKDYFWSTYDIEPPKDPPKPDEKEEPPPPPPPEEKAPPPPPIEQPQAVKPPPDDPYKDEPPPVAQANHQEVTDDPYASWSTSQGNGTNNSGKVSDTGKVNGHVEDPRAAATGTPHAPPPPPPAVDHSKPATLVGSTAWNCPFPPEADSDGRDSAVATIVVTVRPDGTPQAVSVIADPGSGFGRAARACALGRRYQAGLDKDGNPTTATTPPIRVRFSR